MRKPIEVFTRPDFEYEVIDVFIRINGVEMHYKGFDETEWKEAEELIEELVCDYGFYDLGELEETTHCNFSEFSDDELLYFTVIPEDKENG